MKGINSLRAVLRLGVAIIVMAGTTVVSLHLCGVDGANCSCTAAQYCGQECLNRCGTNGCNYITEISNRCVGTGCNSTFELACGSRYIRCGGAEEWCPDCVESGGGGAVWGGHIYIYVFPMN